MTVQFLVLAISFLIVLTVHEAAHAWVANFLGDPTAKLRGRVSLNPLVHLDPMGTIVLLITGFVGWGKPVPVNPNNFEKPIYASALVALAGPVSNFLLGFVIYYLMFALGAAIPDFLFELFRSIYTLSLRLGVFNLLPFPPLDGSKVLGLFVPKKWHYKYASFLESGAMYFFMFLLFDNLFLQKFLNFSVLRNFIYYGVSLIDFLIVRG